MTENNGGRNESRAEAPDLIDEALKLVDTLQRKLLAAGVRRGVDAVTRPQPKKDVWEEAIRLEGKEERPPLEEFVDIVRKSAPEVAGHLGRAGLSLAGALGRTWGVVERGFEQGRAEAERTRVERQARERSDRERDERVRRESFVEESAGDERGDRGE